MLRKLPSHEGVAELAPDFKWHSRRMRHPQAQMTMIRLSDAQRAVLTQTLPAVAHLGLGALVFGQFLRDQPFSWWLASAGVGIWLWVVSVAVAVAGGKRWVP